MKVIQVMAGDEEGGLENHFVELSNGLAKLGVDVVAIGHEKYADRFDDVVQYHCLDLSKSRRNPLTLFKLATVIRHENADIIHAQANKAVAMLASISGLVDGLKIATIHNQKRSRAMFNNMDAVIGVSKGVVANLKHPKLHVVYNGMEPFHGEYLTRADLATNFNLDSSLPISIAVGRLVPTKAFDNLINAWNTDFGQLVIFGDGPEKEKLADLIEQRNLEGRIKLAGFYQGVRSVLKAVDLLVFSSHREGYSYALAEALLAQLPVVSTRVAGAEETLPEPHLVPVNNILELSNTLKVCLSDLQQTKQRMESVFTWAQKTLTVANMVSQTHQVYLQTIEDTK
ncbi:MAG: glycosyltransferase [Pseudomonadales bacterium]|nr:glycosyltransferase [Pseudomonadales bacterium]